MAANTQYIHITGQNWTQVSTDKANVRIYNPKPQPIMAAIASSVNDLNNLVEGHTLDHDEELTFNNLADSQNLFLKASNGDAFAIVTATDARLASGGAPQTGLTDSQLRASPVPVTVSEDNPIAVQGDFYPDVQDVNLVSSTIVGSTNDAAASSDNSNSSLISLVKRLNQNITSLSGKLPNSFGRTSADNSSPVVLSNEDLQLIGDRNESLPTNDDSISGLNGRLKRIAVNLTNLTGKFPVSLGQTASANSLPITLSIEDSNKLGSVSESAPISDIASSGLNGRLQRIAQNVTAMSAKLPNSLGRQGSPQSFSVALSTGDQALFGQNDDTSPATDTANSAINGRLQRIAQNITSLSGKFPTSLGRTSAANSSPIVLSNEDISLIGAVNEIAPATDTDFSGLNGRLQRVSQRLTTISGQIPNNLGQKTGSNSLSVVLASDQPALTVTPVNTGVVSASNSTTTNLAAGGIFTGNPIDISAYGSVTVSAYSSHISATNGLSIQQSTDATNWFFTDTYTLAAAGNGIKINVPRQAQYLRVVYTNGATATTTFQLQTILNNQMPSMSSVKAADGLAIENDFQEVLSANLVFNGASLDLKRGAINGTNSLGTGIQASQLVAQFDDQAIVTTTENSFGNVRMSSDHILYTASSPTGSAGAAVSTNATTSAGGSIVLKASAGNLYGINAIAGASSGYLMLFNSTTVPLDGTVTPLKCLPISANSGFYITFDVPLRFSNGIVAVFSTTGPFTKTISNTAYISGDFV